MDLALDIRREPVSQQYCFEAVIDRTINRSDGFTVVMSDAYANYFTYAERDMPITTHWLTQTLRNELQAYEEKREHKVYYINDVTNPATTGAPEHKAPPSDRIRTITNDTRDIFLKLHKREMGFFSRTLVKKDGSQSLTKLLEHAQKDTTLLGFQNRTAKLMQKMGWLDANRRVIKSSGLDQALKQEGNQQIPSLK